MADVTVIGRGTRIRGRVAGTVDLEIAGFIDGEVAVDGDVTIEAQGIVGANVTGRRLTVRGAVKGDLIGAQAVVLEEGARVVGDVRAPRVSIAQGALVRGYVQTSGVEAAPQRARAAAPAARPQQATKASPAPMHKPAPAPMHKPAPAPVAKTATNNHAPPHAARQAPVALAGGAPKAPPAPIVPALKKGAKGALNKKRAH